MSGRRIYVTTDRSAPGLMRYGLHRELSSDTDDTDYEPGMDLEDIEPTGKKRKRKIESESSSSDVDSYVEPSNESESTASFSDSNASSSESGESQSTARFPVRSKVKERKPRKKNLMKKNMATKKKCSVNQKSVLMKKPTVKRTGRKKIIKMPRFGDPLQLDDNDSDDEDYVPEFNVEMEKRKNLNDFSDEEDFSLRKGRGKVEIIKSRTTEHPKSDTWADLPVEILSRIFSLITETDEKGARFVARCASVCTWWKDVAMQPSSWAVANLAFVAGYEKSNDKLLSKLCRTLFASVTEINLSGWTQLTTDGVKSIAHCCPRLESINFSHCQKKTVSKISAESLLLLAERCPDLKSISLSSIRLSGDYRKLVTQFIEMRGHNLTHLNFSQNIVYCGSWLLTCIIKSCPQLLTLDLSNTSVRNISFDALQSSCPKLQELFLTNVQLEPAPVGNIESSGFKNLETVSFGTVRNYWCTESLFKYIIHASSKLRLLDIRGHTNLTESAFKAIPSNNIERLYMARCRVTHNMLHQICSKWRNTLTYIDFSRTEPYGVPFDVLIETLACGRDACRKLRFVDLSGTSVSDSGVKYLLVGCIDLEHLDLTSCRGVSRGIKRSHNAMKEIMKLRKYYEI